MKREGRQHGMVLTCRLLPHDSPRPANTRVLNEVDTSPVAGLFTRVSSKPTNHSKFTGKCGKPRCASCHIRPSSKSKEKTKGSNKVRVNFNGSSATANLDRDYDYDYNHDYDDRVDDDDDDDHDRDEGKIDDKSEGKIDDKSDDKLTMVMNVCDVGMGLFIADEEDWCLVAEM